jgi:hypothetical protein
MSYVGGHADSSAPGGLNSLQGLSLKNLLSTDRGNYASTNKAPHPSPLPRGARGKEASLVLSGRVFTAQCT